MPSGKQVLLHLLEEYSQKLQDDEDLSEVSENLRIALLLHGSTSEDMWFNVERISWLSETDENGEVDRQGLGIKGKNIFLSDIFESMTYDSNIPERVKIDFPDLTDEEFESANHIMWLLLIAPQFFSSLSSIENEGNIDLDQVSKHLIGYRKKLAVFRKDPGDYLGWVDEEMKRKCREKLDEIG